MSGLQEPTFELIDAFAASESVRAVDAAVLVNRCLDPEVDVAVIEERLDALARLMGAAVPWEFLAREGFGGRYPTDLAAASCLLDVLERREPGLPITLGVMLLHLCEASGRLASGINFPGLFLVRADGALVDPLAMSVRSEQELLAALPVDQRGAAAFAQASPRDILLRMLNNLKLDFTNRAEYHKGLEMLDYQLRLRPDDGWLRFEQGELWLRLGSIGGARLAYQQMLASGSGADARLVEMARGRLAELEGRADDLH